MTAIATATIASSVIGYSSASKASKAQERAADKANATQKQLAEQTRQDQVPYRELGYAALDKLRARMGLSVMNPSQMDYSNPKYNPNLYGQSNSAAAKKYRQNVPETIKKPWTNNALFAVDDLMKEDPSYQFRLAQGEQGINRSAAAGSGLLSGATLKALAKYNQDFASNEFQNSFNRLAALSGIGQTATNFVGGIGQNAANNIAANQIGAGNTRAAAYIGQGNAANSAIGMGVNNMQFNQLLNRFPPQGSSNNGGRSGGAPIEERSFFPGEW